MHSSIQRDGHDKYHDSKFSKKAIEAQHVQNDMERKRRVERESLSNYLVQNPDSTDEGTEV